MRRIFWLAVLGALALAACVPPAAAPGTEKATPGLDVQPTAQDGGGVTPVAPQGQVGALEPAELALEVLAWGAPVDGLAGALPQAAVFTGASGRSAPLALGGGGVDAAWVDGLPAEVRAALERTPPAAGEWFILLYGGQQPCPAYWVSADSLRIEGRTLRVAWQVNPPPPGTGCASVMAYPYLLLRLTGITLLADEALFDGP